VESVCSSLDVCHDVTLIVNLNIIVLFLPCAVSLDFSNTVFWGLDFLCHLAWGRIDFYRLRLCGKIFS
jgi:hypothetical protein